MDEFNRDSEIIDDRYKIVETAGVGGMAVVYKARDLITDKDVAVKMMKPETASKKVNLTRFEREARAAASLNHPNIVKVINVGTYQNLPYMVNEFIYGKNLHDALSARGKFSFLEACDIMHQLCAAVHYAHTHGVIHRDLKPQNVFLTVDGIVKLSDFGIAVFLNAPNITAAKSDTIVGTAYYVAPEICKGGQATAQSDIYALGITFFELITGRVPFDGDSAKQVIYQQTSKRFPSIKKYNAKTPECIENIIYKACAKVPSERYATCAQMEKDINEILKNPDLMKHKTSALYTMFHPNSPVAIQRRGEKNQKKELQKATKAAKKDRNENGK